MGRKWNAITKCNITACQQCADSAVPQQSNVIMALITRVPTLVLSDIQRSTVKGDSNAMKFMAVFTGVFGLWTTVNALLIFQGSCLRNNSEVDTETGPGMLCMYIAMLLLVADILLHLILAAPKKEEVE